MSACPFIRAVIAQPDDDLPRLIYADWLEEHAGQVAGACPTCHCTGLVSNGNAERAAFIRVQCELAGLPSGPLYIDPDSPEQRAALTRAETLRRRERELLSNRHPWAWEGEAVCAAVGGFTPAPTGGPSFQFRRGFVESITCTSRGWLEHADAIVATCPIRDVTLTTWPEVRQDTFAHANSGFFWLIGRDKTLSFADVAADEWLARGALARRLLALEWPAIRFTLPPVDPTPLVRMAQLFRHFREVQGGGGGSADPGGAAGHAGATSPAGGRGV